MSRYKPYPKYKDSGMDWFDKIPEHWDIGLLSSLFSDNKEKNTGLNNSNLLSLSYGNIIRKDIDTSTGLLPDSFDSYQIVHPGYIVLRLTDLQNDKKSLRTGFVKETGIITSAYIGLAKKSKSIGNEKYFYLYLYTFDAHKGFYGMGAGVRQGLNFNELKKLKFALPPLEEQNQIVECVEKETAKIDTLIAKQERMIELLGEKRQALISHTVTKGLDPSVKMKDSGAEWLGEVPEHWGIHKLKYAVERIGDIDHYMPKTVSIGKPYIMTGDMSEKASLIDFSSCKQISEEDFSKLSQKIRPSIGDLIFARYATIGTVCYVDIEDDFLVSYSCVTIKPNHGKTSGKYLFYFFKSNFFLEEIKSYINSNTQGNVGVESLYRTKLAIPPQNEQRFIIDFIEEKTAKIDTLIQKAKQAIELLKERRTALISAAVTGKIDVRDAL